MEENTKLRLCGGTFFVLLLQARKQRTAARENAEGKKDGLNDSNILEGLIRVILPDYSAPAGRTFKTHTSKYKSCKLSSNDYLPFGNTEIIENFNQALLADYQTILERMCKFTSRYIDENNMGNWLVRAVLELVKLDDSITDEVFYIENANQPIGKDYLIQMTEVALQPFLLGIWHFILTQRSDNTIGQETFNAWHDAPVSERAQRSFSSNIGKSRSHFIQVSILDSSAEETSTSQNSFDDEFIHLLQPENIVPELTEEPPLLLVRKNIFQPEHEYSEYLENAREKYNKMKTLLYSDTPKPFYDFYVCNDVYQQIYIKKYTYHRKTLHNVNADILNECSNFVLISGTGGLGKSMMMRHLLLDAVENYDEAGRIPIFIPLKDYSNEYENLLEYIYEKFDDLGGNKTIEEFSVILEDGICLLLFDGLDEINSEYRNAFERELDSFADKYTDNMFVISSRPTGSFLSFSRFTVLNLSPFTKDQALQLVDKLDFRPDEPAIKAKFREELERELFFTHREFTENPLLLTIMLMTYEQFAEIPSKMHIFYREAYVALSQKHDASKGAYKRVLKTGLSADRFSDYFAEFCARSYRDEKFEFTQIEFEKYYNSLNEKNKETYAPRAGAFLDDLVENMCLMFYESGKYHFTHRSFQEYFCALYFSKQKDKTLEHIGNFFENKRNRNYTDRTFHMLYDMIPEKIEEYIFEPFLKTLFDECDSENGYWTFLERMYPVLYYEEGETDGFSSNSPQSFLFDFIITQKNFWYDVGEYDLPTDEEFVTAEWVYLDEEWNDPDMDTDGLVNASDVPREYTRLYGDPDVVGRNFELNIKDILNNPDFYNEVITSMEDESFPLMKQFTEVRDYMQELMDKHSVSGNDLFDLFQ